MKITEVKPRELKISDVARYTDKTETVLVATGLRATRRFEVHGPWTKAGAVQAVAQEFNLKPGNPHPWSPSLKLVALHARRIGLRTFEVVAAYGKDQV